MLPIEVMQCVMNLSSGRERVRRSSARYSFLFQDFPTILLPVAGCDGSRLPNKINGAVRRVAPVSAISLARAGGGGPYRQLFLTTAPGMPNNARCFIRRIWLPAVALTASA